MDLEDFLQVRFHWSGKFKNYGTTVDYVGGYEAVSFIERDKISLPEIVGHLRDHCNVGAGVLLHWLFPGKGMKEGLRVLVDDNACLYMSHCIVDGGVADIYVEEPAVEVISDDGEWIGEKGGEVEVDERLPLVPAKSGRMKHMTKGKEIVPISVEEDQEDSDSDSDFTVGDDCASEDDEEAELILSKFVSFKKKLRKGEMAGLDDVVLDNTICPGILKKLNTYITQSAYCHALSNGAHKFEVKHFDNRFTVDLANKECSCRYWQFSGLPCPHAISCIYYSTNTLDAYIADCYSVEDFKQTNAYCLQPVEGMNGWPQSDRPKLQAPGYIRMPGRPRTERRREFGEKPRGPKMSRVGTVIRCRKCKGIGHNISTCGKRSGSSAHPGPHAAQSANSVGGHSQNYTAQNSAPVGGHSQNSAPIVGHSQNENAMIVLSGHEQSTNRNKRRSSTSQDSMKSMSSSQMATSSNQPMVRTSASARVSTTAGGSATINLHAQVPTSKASSSVKISINSGKAAAHVSANEPPKKKSKPASKPEMLIMFLPPWQSEKL